MTATPTATDTAREKLTIRLNKIIGALSGRDDVLLSVDWDGNPAGTPAYFKPATAHVTINAAVALRDINPADVNPLTPAGRAKHPVLVGLCAHEAAHAHCTEWGQPHKDADRAVAEAATLLEEPRIEHRQLQRRPQDRPYLRAQSLQIDLEPLRTPEGAAAEFAAYRAAVIALLVLGRVDAGVLRRADVEDIEPRLEEALGDLLPRLRALWREALTLKDRDSAGLVDVARRWVALIPAPPTPPRMTCSSAPSASGEEGEPGESGEGSSAPGESGESSDDKGGSAGGADAEDADEKDADGKGGSGDDTDKDTDGGKDDKDGPGGTGDDLLDAIKEALGEAAASAAAEVEESSESSTSDAAHEALLSKKDAIEAHKKDAKKAKDVYSHGYSRNGLGADVLGHPRTPSHADRLLARKVGEALRKAAFNDPARIKTPTAIPAGRLVTRDGVQRSAQKAMGQPITAKPFRVTKRRHTPEPPVKVGLMLDVSGSMGWACPVLTASAWAFAHAVKSIGGTFTAVGFGERIYPLVPPGSTPAQVTPISAVDGHEAFSAGFSTVNGALGLTVGDGVRLLVVVSDGHLVARGEPEKARKAVDAVIRAGGHVLWFDRSPRDPRVIPDGASYAQVTNPDDIPAAMVAALRDALHGR